MHLGWPNFSVRGWTMRWLKVKGYIEGKIPLGGVGIPNPILWRKAFKYSDIFHIFHISTDISISDTPIPF